MHELPYLLARRLGALWRATGMNAQVFLRHAESAFLAPHHVVKR